MSLKIHLIRHSEFWGYPSLALLLSCNVEPQQNSSRNLIMTNSYLGWPLSDANRRNVTRNMPALLLVTTSKWIALVVMQVNMILIWKGLSRAELPSGDLLLKWQDYVCHMAATWYFRAFHMRVTVLLHLVSESAFCRQSSCSLSVDNI